MFCPNCGKEIIQIVNFCPFCGYSLQESPSTAVSLTSSSVSSGTYGLVLVSCGTCSESVTADLLEDIFGYSDSYAKNLIREAPVEIGQKMSESEASYVAQVFSEYGIEVSVINENDEYIDLSKNSVSSIFNSDGSLIAAAAAVIGALSVANRVTSYRRFKKPSLITRIFKTLFTPTPPKHVRRFRPAPKPADTMPLRHPQTVRPVRQDYRNAGEHVRRSDPGHKGGPNGRMGGGMKKGRM